MIPTCEPLEITAGDTLSWVIALPDFKASDGWTLSYSMLNELDKITITTTPSGDDHLVGVSAVDSAKYQPGSYDWLAYVSKAPDRYQVASGHIKVNADPVVIARLDLRTHARKVLDKIEAVIEGRATKDQMAYTIDGRSLSLTPLADLVMLRGKYRDEVRSEKVKEDLASGKNSGSQILTQYKDFA